MLALKPLTPGHVEAACRLSEEAAWNQTAQDWLWMITRGHGVGVFEAVGALAATALVLPFAEHVAWISMVLVTQAWRRQGLATRLVRYCLAYSQQAGMTTVLLDATEAGRTVYEPLGFDALYSISRWERAALPRARVPDAENTAVRLLTAADLDTLAVWDHARTGIRRAPVLKYCWQAAPHLAHVAEEACGNRRGYGLGRPGNRATQLGPLIADEAATARLLIRHALAKTAGVVYTDVPDAQTGLTQTLIEAGFTRQRGFVRMANGADCPTLPTASVYAIAGPDLG